MFKNIVIKEKLYKLIIFSFILIFTISLFIFSSCIKLGVCKGIEICLNILIPSLFPFMFLTNFIVETGLDENIGKVFYFAFNKLYNLPKSAFAVIILSLIGGYPAGAVGIKSLVEQGKINKNKARQMAYFCVGAGPAYVINIVGLQVYNSFKLGIILLIAQIMSILLLGLISCKVKKTSYQKASKSIIKEPVNFSNSFVYSCKNAAVAMGSICSFVVLFSAFIILISSIDMLDPLYNLLNIPKPLALACVSSMLEITNGTTNFANLNSLYAVSFFLGFGGFCVHFQVLSILKNIHIKYIKFLIFRILQGLISALFTFLLLRIFPTVVSTCQSYNCTKASLANNNAVASLSILLMSVILIISINKDNKKYQN